MAISSFVRKYRPTMFNKIDPRGNMPGAVALPARLFKKRFPECTGVF
jgi:hypothetical protein